MLRRAFNLSAMVRVTRQSSLVPVQARMIHPRGYTNFDDHFNFIFHEINFALNNSKNTDNLVYVYQKFG